MFADLSSPCRIGGEAYECMYASACADSAAMRIAKALTRRHGHLGLTFAIAAVDVAVQAAVADVLVDQHGHLDLEAASEQLHG